MMSKVEERLEEWASHYHRNGLRVVSFSLIA